MKIFLIRHAQSESNVNPYILLKKTNMAVDITDVGQKQAHDTGEYLKNYFSIHNPGKIKVWNSPYLRTRKTASIIKNELATLSFDTEESLYISERQFGLVDTVENYRHLYKDDANFYKLYKESGQDFFVRPPGGESPYDMCLRIDYFIRNVLDKDVDTHVIVSHGAAIRGFILMYLKEQYECYEKYNPSNCSINLLENNSHKLLKS